MMVFDEDPFNPNQWLHAKSPVSIWDESVFEFAVKQRVNDLNQSDRIRNDPFLLKKRREMQKKTDRSYRHLGWKEKMCAKCGKVYKPTGSRQKFCQKECQL